MQLFKKAPESKVKSLIKNYEKLYKQLFKIEKVHDEVVDELKNVTSSQLRVLLTDIEMSCIAIDRMMEDISKDNPDIYRKFFNTIPKFSNFDKGESFVSGDSKIFVLPEKIHDDEKLSEIIQSRDLIKQYYESLIQKIEYGDFVANGSGILSIQKTPLSFDFDYEKNKQVINENDYPRKLKSLMERDIRYIQLHLDNIGKVFENTHSMLYNNFLFEDLPMQFDDDTFKLHLSIQFLIKNKVIDKNTPYKNPVYGIPDVIKPHAQNIGLINIEKKESNNA